MKPVLVNSPSHIQSSEYVAMGHSVDEQTNLLEEDNIRIQADQSVKYAHSLSSGVVLVRPLLCNLWTVMHHQVHTRQQRGLCIARILTDVDQVLTGGE